MAEQDKAIAVATTETPKRRFRIRREFAGVRDVTPPQVELGQGEFRHVFRREEEPFIASGNDAIRLSRLEHFEEILDAPSQEQGADKQNSGRSSPRVPTRSERRPSTSTSSRRWI